MEMNRKVIVFSNAVAAHAAFFFTNRIVDLDVGANHAMMVMTVTDRCQ
jgi:hypothetical protein